MLVVLLEVPAILAGIVLARGLQARAVGPAAREVFLGKGIVLLLGGLAIGWLAGPEALASIQPLFFDLFKGVLACSCSRWGSSRAPTADVRRHGRSSRSSAS